MRVCVCVCVCVCAVDGAWPHTARGQRLNMPVSVRGRLFTLATVLRGRRPMLPASESPWQPSSDVTALSSQSHAGVGQVRDDLGWIHLLAWHSCWTAGDARLSNLHAACTTFQYDFFYLLTNLQVFNNNYKKYEKYAKMTNKSKRNCCH